MLILYNKEIKIEFDNGSNVFGAGDNVSGSVELQLIIPKIVKSFYVELLGKTETNFQNTSDENAKTVYKGEAIIVHTRKYLCGRINSKAPQTIPTGHYSFPFSFRLPANAPPTFTGIYGRIVYKLVVVTNLYGSNCTEEEDSPIIVRSAPISLFGRNYLKPRRYTLQKDHSLLCIPLGVTVKAYLAKQIFKPGQTILIHIECINNSLLKIKTIQMELIKMVAYSFETPKIKCETDSKCLASAITGTVAKRSTEKFDVEIKIPQSLVLEDLTNSTLITENFAIFVKVKLCKPNSFNAQIPIEIVDVIE